MTATPTNQSFFPFSTEYRPEDVISLGRDNAVVYRTTHARTGTNIAVKRVVLNHVKRSFKEANILQKLASHGNVIEFRGEIMTPEYIYIQMPLSEGSLGDAISNINNPSSPHYAFAQQYSALDKRMRRFYLRDMVNGISHLHKNNIVHRAVQPSNFLFYLRTDCKNGDGQPEYKLVVADFAWCRELPGGDSSFSPSSTGDTDTHANWHAPEVREDHKILNEATIKEVDEQAKQDTENQRRLRRPLDMFSLGCVFYYALTGGSHPFGNISDINEIDENVEKGKPNLSALPASVQAEAVDLISLMIALKPDARPEADRCLEHPLLWSDDRRRDFLTAFNELCSNKTLERPSITQFNRGVTSSVLGGANWRQVLGEEVVGALEHSSKYGDGTSVQELVRALRNLLSHWNRIIAKHPALGQEFGLTPADAWQHFDDRFPELIIYIYNFVRMNLQLSEHLRPYLNFR